MQYIQRKISKNYIKNIAAKTIYKEKNRKNMIGIQKILFLTLTKTKNTSIIL